MMVVSSLSCEMNLELLNLSSCLDKYFIRRIAKERRAYGVFHVVLVLKLDDASAIAVDVGEADLTRFAEVVLHGCFLI